MEREGITVKIPRELQKIIGDRTFTLDTIGMSDSQVLCFEDMILKTEKQGEEAENEYRMISWLAGRLPVPEILYRKQEEGIHYLLMSRIQGSMACSPEWMENPSLLVELLAEGLQMLWNVDVKDCPYDNLLYHRLKLAESRIAGNLCSMEDAEPETYGENGFASPAELLQWLKENCPEEQPVLSHGDYCLPNILIHNNKINGFIDLGRCGTADKYQDIALCYRSLKHNFDGTYGGKVYPGFYPEMLFEELNMEPDWDAIRYYILLDELF